MNVVDSNHLQRYKKIPKNMYVAAHFNLIYHLTA